MESWVKGKVADGRQVIACATGITGGGKSVAMQESATMINEAMGNTCIIDEYIPPSGVRFGKLSDQLKIVIESCTRAARKNLLICTPEEHAIPQIDASR